MATGNQTLTDSSAAFFTCTNAGGSAITSLTFKNHSASAVTVTFHVCPDSNPPNGPAEGESDENMIYEISIPAEDTYYHPCSDSKIIMALNDALEAFASTTSVITVSYSYLDL